MLGPIGLLGPIGTTELIIILVIVVLIFGVNKIPQLGKGLGEGIRNFKSSIKEISAESDKKQQEEDEKG
jgi:sec-independent protein translocase protein TatA